MFLQSYLRSFFLIFISVASLQTVGQDVKEDPAPKKEEEKEEQLRAVRIADIATVSGESHKLIQDIGNQGFTETDTGMIASIDSLLIIVDRFMELTTKDSLQKISLIRLDEIRETAGSYIDFLNHELNRLTRESQSIEENLTLIASETERWELTRHEVSTEGAPEAIQKRVEVLISDMDSVKLLLDANFNIILIVQDRISERINSLTILVDQIRDQESKVGESLAKRELPFHYTLGQRDSTQLIAAIKMQFSDRVSADAKLLKPGDFIIMGILTFFALVLILVSLTYRKRISGILLTRKSDLKAEQIAVLEMPMASIVFVFAILVRLSLPELPQTISSLLGAIIIISLSTILAHLYGKVLGRGLIILILIALFFAIVQLSYVPGVLHRLALLIGSVLLFIFYSLMLIQRTGIHLIRQPFTYWTLWTLLLLIDLIILASIVGNLLGYLNLTETFIFASIKISLVFIVVLGAIKVFNSLTFLLLSTNTLRHLNIVQDDTERIYRNVKRITLLVFLVFFFLYALDAIRVKDAFLEWGNRVLTTGWKIGEASISLASVLMFFFILWLSIVISRFICRILDKDVFVRTNTSKGMSATIIMLLRFTLITAGFFLAVAAAGIRLTSLSIIIGAFSVGVGFGLQTIFNNLVSGLILAFERPMKVGDTVQLDNLIGEVKSIGMRSSNIKSFDGSEVIVPNGQLISNKLINWTLSNNLRRMDLKISVPHGTKPKLVQRLLREAAEEIHEVRRHPEPLALFEGFGDSAMNFALLAWTGIEQRRKVESELFMKISEKLAAAGIEIPFPKREIMIKKEDQT